MLLHTAKTKPCAKKNRKAKHKETRHIANKKNNFHQRLWRALGCNDNYYIIYTAEHTAKHAGFLHIVGM